MSAWRIDGLAAEVDRFRLGPVDLAVEPGGAVAVLGRSGAGKTTLLRTIAGFVPARRGQVRRDGADVTRALPEHRGLGYVPQGLGLFPHRTVEANVRFPLEMRERPDARGTVRELLRRFDLTGLGDRRPHQLSGGEAQRVALARALAAEPSLILWDEPWTALDVEARHALGEVLHDLRSVERIPVVVVTHDPGLAFGLADRFVVLRDGAVVFAGSSEALLDAPPDPFAARFVGFENVFGRAALSAGPAGGFAAWLLERSGPDGVAFAAPSVAGGDVAPRWSGVVRSARPTPQGTIVEVRVDGLIVTLRAARRRGERRPAPRAPVAFDLDAAALSPLGTSRPVRPEGA